MKYGILKLKILTKNKFIDEKSYEAYKNGFYKVIEAEKAYSLAIDRFIGEAKGQDALAEIRLIDERNMERGVYGVIEKVYNYFDINYHKIPIYLRKPWCGYLWSVIKPCSGRNI